MVKGYALKHIGTNYAKTTLLLQKCAPMPSCFTSSAANSERASVRDKVTVILRKPIVVTNGLLKPRHRLM